MDGSKLKHPIEFLTNNGWFIATLIFTGIWQATGYGAVIYLAALAGINPELYEAAMIDGANRWKQTLYVTLPCLTPTIVILFILSLGGMLNAGFDQIYNMYNPMVYGEFGYHRYLCAAARISMDFSWVDRGGVIQVRGGSHFNRAGEFDCETRQRRRIRGVVTMGIPAIIVGKKSSTSSTSSY